MNVFGTVERVAWGMDRTPNTLRDVGKMLAFLRQPEPPGGFREAWEMLPLLKSVLSMKPGSVRSAPCQEVIIEASNVDLSRLPYPIMLAGRTGTVDNLASCCDKGPGQCREDNFNLGIYRMQVTGPRTTLMRWLKHRGGAQHYQRWKANGRQEPMPVAVVLGADPGTILAAVTPVPETLSEYQFAGLLRGKKVDLVPCRTVPLKVPAEAEIILEGHVHLDRHENEGPYGDHTGYYNSVEPFPVFEISCATMRHSPIYLSTFTGRPPDEPSVLGEALNDVFVPLLVQQFPEVIDFWLPPKPVAIVWRW